MRVTDDLGRTIEIAAEPRRVVSLVPSVTEMLAAFGLGERLVGVTDWCTEPADAVACATRVGHVVAPDAARVAALAPDLVLANAEENREHAIRKLEAAGLPVYVSFPRTVDASIACMARLAGLTGTEAGASPYIQEARQALEEARKIAGSHAPVPYFCAIWKDPWMTANDDTYLADLLRLAGGRNVFAGEEQRYPQTSLAAVRAREPAVALLPTEPYAFTEDDRRAIAGEVPGIEPRLVDGMLLAWHGVRTARALQCFARFFAGDHGAAAPRSA